MKQSIVNKLWEINFRKKLVEQQTKENIKLTTWIILK